MKKRKQTDGIKKVTTAFVYGLFALLVLAVVFSAAIPFGLMLFNPATKHFDVAVILVSLVAGAVLPALISYLLGDRSTRTKSAIEHHFNGVLFGVAAYWLSIFFSFISSSSIEFVRESFSEPLATIINGWPILATVLVMSIVAVNFAKKKRVVSLLEFWPYQLVLFGGILAALAYPLLYIFGHGSTSYVLSFDSVAVPVVFFGLSYVVLPRQRRTRLNHLTLSAVAYSIGYIASTVGGQLLSEVPHDTYQFEALTIGFLVLAAYLLLIRRAEEFRPKSV